MVTEATEGRASTARHATATEPADLTIGELVSRLSSQVTELVRGELELARTELATKGKRAGVGAGLAGAGRAVRERPALVAGAALGVPVALLLVGRLRRGRS